MSRVLLLVADSADRARGDFGRNHRENDNLAFYSSEQAPTFMRKVSLDEFEKAAVALGVAFYQYKLAQETLCREEAFVRNLSRWERSAPSPEALKIVKLERRGRVKFLKIARSNCLLLRGEVERRRNEIAKMKNYEKCLWRESRKPLKPDNY